MHAPQKKAVYWLYQTVQNYLFEQGLVKKVGLRFFEA
jgi:hypothetical protein